MKRLKSCFKPYYNWNTFNTNFRSSRWNYTRVVLNLIITGIPSIQEDRETLIKRLKVLNLIITGIPSILL